jgi:putative redox protein
MEMVVKGSWQGKRHFQAEGPSGHLVHMDARVDDGGEDLGNRPMELLLMGLIGCTGIDISMILERMRQPVESIDIDAAGTRREEYPQSFTTIHLTYKINGDIPEDKAWRAIQLSEEKYCSATASLSATIVPHLVLNGQPLEAPDAHT